MVMGTLRQETELAIVGEPTRSQVVTTHKGSLWIQLETRGRSAHGATPHLGRNAVHQMAQIVHLLETDYAARLAARPHPVLGPPTVSVGLIQGGTQANIVPDFCRVLIDRRTVPGETVRSVRRNMLSLLGQAGLRASFASVKSNDCLPMETSEGAPFVKQLLRCAGQVHGLGVDYFCDASILSEAGIPSVVFGPGDIAQAHTSDEWISLRSLETARSILLAFLQSLP